MNYYVMERLGSFIPAQATGNQCKGAGHINYDYLCRIVFDSNQSLDENDFLIDHIDVDKIVTSVEYVGSCERMHIQMHKAVKQALKEKGIKIVGLATIITPIIFENGRFIKSKATLTHIWFQNSLIIPFLK